MMNQEQISGKWTEIKGGIRNLWGKITDDELEQAKGNIQSVSGIVKQKYSETSESIQTKLDSLMDSFDNDTDKSLKLNDGESSFERSPTDVRTSQVSQNQDSTQDLKTRSVERAKFDTSIGGAINTKQGIASNEDNADLVDEEGADSTLHFTKDDENQTESLPIDERSNFSNAEDKIARH